MSKKKPPKFIWWCEMYPKIIEPNANCGTKEKGKICELTGKKCTNQKYELKPITTTQAQEQNMNQKLCPLRKYTIKAEREEAESFNPCEKENCAWWLENPQMCAIPCLVGIEDRLTEIRNRFEQRG